MILESKAIGSSAFKIEASEQNPTKGRRRSVSLVTMKQAMLSERIAGQPCARGTVARSPGLQMTQNINGFPICKTFTECFHNREIWIESQKIIVPNFRREATLQENDACISYAGETRRRWSTFRNLSSAFKAESFQRRARARVWDFRRLSTALDTGGQALFRSRSTLDK
jgi:hypothetical protein